MQSPSENARVDQQATVGATVVKFVKKKNVLQKNISNSGFTQKTEVAYLNGR